MTVQALTKAMDMARALSGMSHQMALDVKAAGLSDRVALTGALDLGDWQAQAKNRESYGLFRSWVYAAVNAIASEAGGQPCCVALMKKEKKPKKKRRMAGTKSSLDGMTKNVRHKALTGGEEGLEVMEDHWMIDLMDKPNPLQYRFQFVYSFVANLLLTGRAYIVMDTEGDKPVYYSLPTTWVRPSHKKGPFSEFYVANPRAAFVENQDPIPASQVAMAYLPSPSDPMGCMSPASSQQPAIQIDDKVQTCQVKFFDNGPFPSMVVTIGKDPHPDVPGGVRPRLTATQRRQVTGAIKRVMGGVANYGSPAIVDGLIESITRLTPAQNEIGWEKSEQTIKNRILSAFCVHPFILGEAVPIGGYAQVFVIKERFYDRVNIYLDMLSTVMTEFVNRDDREDNDNLLIWWEALKATDPSMEKSAWEAARARRDVTPNEWRSYQGLPPQEDEENWSITTDGMANSVITLMEKVGGGAIQRDQAQAILVHMGVPEEHAENILGEEPEEPEPAPAPIGLVPGQPGQVPGQPVPGQQPPAGKPPKKPKPGEENPVEEATEELKTAVALLKTPVQQLVNSLAGSLGLE